jgi:hypothetical protein
MNLSYVIIGVIVFVFVLIIVLWILKKMKGSIEIIPEKYNYDPGETIKGELILRLERPVKSDKLILGLLCERKEKIYSNKSHNNQEGEVTLFDFNQPLEGKKEYNRPKYSYDFSIVIPLNVSQVLEGVSTTLAKSIQDLTGYNTLAKWYLYAELQCEGVNLSKRVPINID